MANHTFFGKRELCYTEVVDFTDFQGIGHDPLYRRYDSVLSVVKTAILPNFQHFLAAPQYLSDEDQICWHIDEWTEPPIKFSDLSSSNRVKYEPIKDETIRHYKSVVANLSGEERQILSGAIKYIDDERIYCTDGKVFLIAWGMTPDTRMHKVTGSIIHEYDSVKRFKVSFEVGEHGSFASKLDKYITKAEGTTLSKEDIPQIICNDGWELVGWEPSPLDYIVKGNETFTAQYKYVEAPAIPIPNPEESLYNCIFDAGECGVIDGIGNIKKAANSTINYGDIPKVKPNKGYKFTGWNQSPYNCLIDGDKIFLAQYEKTLPWYKRWWKRFVGKGCLKWLLWLLFLLLLLALLLFFIRKCKVERPVNGVVPLDTIEHINGKRIDNNGYVHPITDDEGILPGGERIVAPIIGKIGKDIEEPHIIEQPIGPDIIANRLFLFIEDENDNVDALARDFKKAYPGKQYGIIGFDKEVKLLVIQIPEAERDNIRKTINRKIPNHRFIAFDEEIYELMGNDNSSSQKDIGWHLKAIHLKQGWAYTKGSRDVKVAIVDDGIQASHPMFKERIVDAYNVYTQNNSLSIGSGHGTHTAGLAVGSDEFYNKGASGVAPNCLLMPIQVFDNQRCPLSALIAGVMYALHHDADVVNISIAPPFQGLNELPVAQQREIAETQFQNVASLWNRVCKLAARKKCILVFAAGNDDILTSIPPENRNESSIVVTAVDKRMYPTVFTNYGPCSDISAPGKNIYSAYPTNSFKLSDGTSMATPIVSGTIALMKSINKDLTVGEVRNVLFSTGADVYGWIPPMVLVDKALEATKNGNFKKIERQNRPVPDGEDIHLHSRQVPINRGGKEEVITKPTKPIQQNPDGIDYEEIYRQIAIYKKKIEELEKLLPNK